MFAVPGWSVSSDTLKKETASQKADASSASSKASKKRKRAGGAAGGQVTASNVADLFETVVEGRKPETSQAEEPVKRQKKAAQQSGKKGSKAQSDETKPGPKIIESSKPAAEVDGDKKSKRDKDKKDKKDKKNKQGKDSSSKDDAANLSKQVSSKTKPAADAVANAPPPLPPAPSKLTPLQASMRQKLISARFRHLNETLYTRPSEEAYSLFQESPEMFDEYHEGFRQQVKVWPENPVDSFLADIRARGKVKPPPKGGHSRPGARAPLPRTMGTCNIADLGCGDARLAESLQATKNKLQLKVHSYDLQSPSPLVTKADIANLPLEDGSVNVAIFCLALMGTNWVDFVEEAYRILHWKGELWVAEIKSRFGPIRNKHAPVNHSVGNRKKAGKKGKGEASEEDGSGRFENDLAVEVDGADDRRRETDVSAFVDVLKTRGFVLQGEQREAIDLSNKMFVKMHFIKGASPTKGKGAKEQEPKQTGKRWIAKRDLGKEEEGETEVNEASILKPCLYKIR